MCRDFGEPDGARTSIEAITKEFFYNIKDQNESDDKTRIIVGAKGSGKTVYLRRMKARLEKKEPSVCVTDIQQEVPPTEYVIRFAQMFKAESITEAWSSLWRIAILRSLISHILKYKKNDFNKNLDEETLQTLLEYEGEFFPEYRVQRSIYTELKDLLNPNFFASAKHFYDFAFAPEWDDIKQLVMDLLRSRSPIYFFVDSVDDEYAHAPMYWMQCQKGLFYRVMRFVRESLFGNKLHVVICVRDNVLASVYRSEHRSRYLDSDHIKILRWSQDDISEFLIQKTIRLDSDLFTDPDGEHSLKNWLGIDQINNTSRGIKENIDSYIVRHTRKSPRDIIVVGNELIRMKENNSATSGYDINREIRSIVGSRARFFGDELIQICANQIMNNLMPNDAGRNHYSELYTSESEFKTSIANDIHSVLQILKNERLTWQEIVELDQLADKTIWKNCQLSDTLWQNGALGYIGNIAGEEKEIFFDYDYTYFLLPRDQDCYILPSFMIDAIGINRDHWSRKPIQGGPENAV